MHIVKSDIKVKNKLKFNLIEYYLKNTVIENCRHWHEQITKNLFCTPSLDAKYTDHAYNMG